MVGPSTPEPDSQDQRRQAIYQRFGIDNQAANFINLTLNNTTIIEWSSPEVFKSVGSFIETSIRENKNPYQCVIAAIYCADNPTQLANAFGLIRGYEVCAKDNYAKVMLDNAKNKFFDLIHERKLRCPIIDPISTEAKSLVGLLLRVSGRANCFDVRQDILRDPNKKQYLAEALLSILTESSSDYHLMKFILDDNGKYDFFRFDKGYKANLSLFDDQASIWEKIKSSNSVERPTPDAKETQRNWVFDQINDPQLRRSLKSLLSDVNIQDFTFSSNEYRDVTRILIPLIEQEGANIYRVLFSLAAVAPNDIYRMNAFGLIRSLEEMAINVKLDSPFFSKMTESINQFLTKSSTPSKVSTEAKFLSDEIVAELIKANTQENLRKYYSNLSHTAPALLPYLNEAYLYTLLRKDISVASLSNLLYASSVFRYGSTSVNQNMFKNDSFSKNVTLDWLYPKGNWRAEAQPQDEVGQLKTELANRDKLLKEASEKSLRDSAVIKALQQEIDSFKKQLEEAERQNMSKKPEGGRFFHDYCGGERDPFLDLGITPQIWNSLSKEQRGKWLGCLRKGYGIAYSREYTANIVFGNTQSAEVEAFKNEQEAQQSRYNTAIAWFHQHIKDRYE